MKKSIFCALLLCGFWQASFAENQPAPFPVEGALKFDDPRVPFFFKALMGGLISGLTDAFDLNDLDDYQSEFGPLEGAPNQTDIGSLTFFTRLEASSLEDLYENPKGESGVFSLTSDITFNTVKYDDWQADININWNASIGPANVFVDYLSYGVAQKCIKDMDQKIRFSEVILKRATMEKDQKLIEYYSEVIELSKISKNLCEQLDMSQDAGLIADRAFAMMARVKAELLGLLDKANQESPDLFIEQDCLKLRESNPTHKCVSAFQEIKSIVDESIRVTHREGKAVLELFLSGIQSRLAGRFDNFLESSKLDSVFVDDFTIEISHEAFALDTNLTVRQSIKHRVSKIVRGIGSAINKTDWTPEYAAGVLGGLAADFIEKRSPLRASKGKPGRRKDREQKGSEDALEDLGLE